MGHKMEDVLREQLRIFADENQIMRDSQAAAVKEAKRLRRDVQELKKVQKTIHCEFSLQQFIGSRCDERGEASLATRSRRHAS